MRNIKLLLTYAHTRSQAPQGDPARRPFQERHDDFCICGYFKVGVDSLTGAVTYPISDALESRSTISWGKTHFQRFAPQVKAALGDEHPRPVG